MEARKKILLVQLYSNGDCLYATSVAKQIKKDFPECHLTWAIAGFCKNIIAHNPFVDEVREVNEVPKNDVAAFRKFRAKVYAEKKQGLWEEVFVTHNMDENQALYDGTIRGMIFRAYPFPITVSVQPVLNLTDEEHERVEAFAKKHHLTNFKNVILWEYAPQSGQAVITKEFVLRLAEKIVQLPSTCIILSSANSFNSTGNIIDASSLTVRENAALTHYCSLLIGCSSGITWLSTSTAARQLPMVQLLDAQAYFLNAPSTDFSRYGISSENLIEITQHNEETIYGCISAILEKGFVEARLKYNRGLPVQFNTTRKIVYNLLCYLQFNAIARHYRIMTSIYGRHPKFIKQFLLGFAGAPFKLIGNIWKKKIANLSTGI
jgi:ADP-heptose:LPS heptosyltransferase